MRLMVSTAVAALVFVPGVFAQSVPSNNSTAPPAVATGTGDSNTTAAPVAGKNSFTEAQARHRLSRHGYKHVSRLTQDDKSIWRGTATKNGKSVDVAVDYQGNITEQ